MNIFRYIVLLASLLVINQSLAAVPTCYTQTDDVNYCNYTGKVERIYINENNLILIYFDTPVDVSVPDSVGFSVTHGNAAAFLVTDNSDFANMFYSTALAAQASGRSVQIQMRGVEGGYLRFDRIWLAQ